MKIIHLAAECYPVAKVGGLGDVVGALGKYLNKHGHEASVILPKYNSKYITQNSWQHIYTSSAKLGVGDFEYSIYTDETNKLGYALYLVEIKGLLDRENVYGYNDDSTRFIAFQAAALDWIIQTERKPDVLNVHDHHAALVPFMIQNCEDFAALKEVPVVLTIHNGQYQGVMRWEDSMILPKWDRWKWGLLDWNKYINPLASGIRCAWKVTTVSNGYLQELRNNSNGLEQLFEMEWEKCSGILNGIDTQVWDPQTDEALTQNYSIKNVNKEKSKNKESLCEQFNLDPEKPLFVFIGRLVGEKAADLLPSAFLNAFGRIGRKMNFLVLGSGQNSVEDELNHLKNYAARDYNAYIGYNENLSHLIYAGADFILMPSRVEPCGLNQLYAMRYGTVPVVNDTGGLHDTVTDITEKDGFGIKMNGANENEIIFGIYRALELYAEPGKMEKVRKRMMKLDHSWDSSIKNYTDLYESLVEKN
jgi:starch synthase